MGIGSDSDFVGLDDQGREVGVEPFYLADYRDGKSDALSAWTWVDLTGLGDNVSRLEFRMDSTDVGQFGMNTPAYFAIDNLTYQVCQNRRPWWELSWRCCY